MIQTNSPIILCSGGFDSLAMVVLAVSQNLHPILLHIKYKHPAAIQELRAVQRIHSAFAGSCKLYLHDAAIHCNAMDIGAGVEGARIVRGRNLLFLSIAYNLSSLFDEFRPIGKKGDRRHIWIGCTKEDQNDYTDCRPEFLYKMKLVLGDNVGIDAPLINRNRSEISAIIPDSLKSMAWSCYQPINGNPCEKCNSCLQYNGISITSG